MQSKWLFLLIALISIILGALPEFISEEMKDAAKNIFGDYYNLVWGTSFLFFGGLFIYLTWKQSKLEKTSSDNDQTTSSQTSKSSNYKINQKNKLGDNVVGDKIIKK